ncbi:fimbrial outer membrane usher protein [Rahnella sikkimica]|uniref:Fimbrial assembly protein n=1 Tax=Rahnella sikkimica TaxID=1805933 RepID=A0A2L1UXD9_9GAMM|nr:fimbrial outer membrane usher protein [Rahnella sikkimica]AVF37626.1 fimbrial assembly protein [Rahnella sikkimica]
MKSITNKKSQTLSLLTVCIMASYSPFTVAEDYYFDPGLLQGSGVSVNLEKLNEKVVSADAGTYRVDLYVNNKLVKENTEITFSRKSEGDNVTVQPCLKAEDIKLIQLKPDTVTLIPVDDKCVWFSDLSKASSWELEQSTQKLKLLIPQSLLYRQPRGYIPVSQWDSGGLGLFIKHNTNYYETRNTGGYKTKNLWSGLNSGTNIGLWQLRNQSNYRYTDNNGRTSHKWTSVRTNAQRPLASINSLITFGDSYTNSSLFGSLSFNGVKLASDTRMMPQGKRGYAPEVRGVASTTARVVVSQLGKTIYETVVSPGPFVIDDLSNTKGQGDLQVTVIEANGQTSSFTVPYSAVPDSVRPGLWNYELALGKVRKYYSVDNEFVEGVVQRGISNRFTGNAGVRLAKDYEAYLLGGVMATQFGAIGVNTTYSHALAENNQRQSGWRAEASYSKTFTTGTNLTLAAYRYSTKGFRDLQDVLGVRRAAENTSTYYSDTLNQKNQFSVTIAQGFDTFGSLSLNASTSDYYSNSSRITQMQLGYSNSYKKISYNINVGRQRTSYSNRSNYYSNTDDSDNNKKYTENTISIGFSMPLDWTDSRSNVSFNVAKNKTSESATTSLSGSVGEKSNLSYSLYSGVENYQSTGNEMTWGGSLQQNTSKGAFRGSYSQGSGYKQFGMGTSGTLLIHPGGVTYGPYVSDTFALVKAKGAKGAEIKNGQGAKIDSFGYAIMPSLSPYRYNTVSLDPKGLNSKVDIQGGSQQVVPYSGAIVQVNFETISGQQVLINTTLNNKQMIPMGADVTDKDGKNLGMVGQAGQIYARINDRSGVLFVSWGKGDAEQCRINYQLPATADNEFVQMTLPCEI